LVRLPNVFTVIADVSAAFLLVAGGPTPWPRLVLVVIGAVFIYWAGMILNDVFDVEIDSVERPTRPIASGRISLARARNIGWGCLIGGGLIAGCAGYISSDRFNTTWLPAITALVLMCAVVLYDGPLKRTSLAPLVMGSCRSLSFLLGASAVIDPDQWPTVFPKFVLITALGFGLYITGLTSIGRREAVGGGGAHVNVGALVVIIGIAVLAFAPIFNGGEVAIKGIASGVFPLAVLLVSFRVVSSAIRAARDPSPGHIQWAVRGGILALIPLAACFAVLGAGAWGIVVFAMVFPAYGLALGYRVT
jgi:4-hydroxybenzoate polyprenyltransferase